MVDESVKDQVKEATDIVAIVGQFVTLKRRGVNLTGLCPFHTEKTPSFTVHADRQFFHCFGCGKGGDVFTFLIEHEGWTFPEALKYCADRAGIQLPSSRDPGDAQSRLREEMAQGLALADEIYRRALFSSTGQHALAYLRKRGFQDQTLKRAGVGYAPPSYETILKAGQGRGMSPKALEAAGLILPSTKGGSFYDRFRNRVIFPIINLSGKTVGFGARALSEEDQPKYMNSPETALYQKGRILYGLATTRDAIRRENRAIIVEGYLDWLTMIEAGIDNVVAVSGTALTDTQAKLLARFCERVTLLFDADAAGQRAALRGIDIVFNAALGVDVAILPAGEDPDSMIRHQGVDAMKRALGTAFGIVEYRVDGERSRAPGARLDFLAQEKLVKEFAELANKLDDPTRRETFLAEVRAHLGIDAATMSRLIPAATPTSRVAPKAPPQARRDVLSPHAEFLRLLLESPDYVQRARIQVLPDDFDHPVLRNMYETLLERTADGNFPRTPQELADDPEEIEHWSRLLSHAIDPDTAERGFNDVLVVMSRRHRPAPQIRQLIAQAERVGDVETAKRLTSDLAEAMRLDRKEATLREPGM